MWRIEALLCITGGLVLGHIIMGFPQEIEISKVTTSECSGEIWELNQE